jgi:hypothetical protein
MVVRASSAIDGQCGALVEMSPERLQLVGARWAGAEVLDPPAAGVAMVTRWPTPVYQRSGRLLVSHRSRCSATPPIGTRASSALLEALLRTDRLG